MNWDAPVAAAAPAATEAWNDNQGGGSSDLEDAGSTFEGISPEHISKHDGSDGNNTCHNCGNEGHFCPEPGANTGECYNCGETGHNKADCVNDPVERAFTGDCRHCGEAGHRAADCPARPPKTCRRCKKEGHSAAECTDAYDIFGISIPPIDPDIAWENLMVADSTGDLDDFKTAFMIYCKSSPEMTFQTMQEAFREVPFKTWLVARQQDVLSTHTIVNLQGESDREFVVTFQYGLAPRRAKLAETWPKTEEENLKRLQNAGFPMDRMVPKCSNCEELGHISKNCPEDKREIERPEIKCSNCHEVGHYVRDCKETRVDKNTCRNCGQSGHRASDCTEPRSAENVECRKCEKTGHFSKDCPDAPKFECRNCGQEGHRASDCTEERKITCRNCNGDGHMSRECPEPRNMANMQCRNCDQMGHSSRECPEPRNWAKVECRNCGETGHGAGRCKNLPKEQAGGDFTGNNGGLDTGPPEVSAETGGWENSAAADSSGDAWGVAAPATATAGGW